MPHNRTRNLIGSHFACLIFRALRRSPPGLPRTHIRPPILFPHHQIYPLNCSQSRQRSYISIEACCSFFPFGKTTRAGLEGDCPVNNILPLLLFYEPEFPIFGVIESISWSVRLRKCLGLWGEGVEEA